VHRYSRWVIGAAGCTIAAVLTVGCGSGGGTSSGQPATLNGLASAAAVAQRDSTPVAAASGSSSPGKLTVRFAADIKDAHRFGGLRTIVLAFPGTRCARTDGGGVEVTADLGTQGDADLLVTGIDPGVYPVPDSTRLGRATVTLAGLSLLEVESGALAIEKSGASTGHLTARFREAPGVSVLMRWSCPSVPGS
jgi:hypothetical protein